jgi:HD-like signal output (HDOD) protein
MNLTVDDAPAWLDANAPTVPARLDPATPTAPAVAEFVASIRHLPLYPGMAAQLVRSVEQENITGPELARQITGDAALSSHLLRLVNSSFHGLSRRIGTVADALAVLGFNMVRRIVTSMVMQRPVLAFLPETETTRAFWRHQLLCAALARFVHRRSATDGEELAYMAGLLHDVGRLAMLVRWPQAYGVLLQAPTTDDAGSMAQEHQHFGFDHAVAGGALLRLWKVPEPIALAAFTHADAAAPEDPVAASVWHANRLADEVDNGRTPHWMKEAGLSAAMRRQIVDEVDAFAGSRG